MNKEKTFGEQSQRNKRSIRRNTTAYNLEDRTWVSIIEALKERIRYLGKPRRVVTDNELNMTMIREFLKSNGMEIYFTSTYNKTGNADVERLNSTLNEHLRLFNADEGNKDDLKGKVSKSIIFYNTIHTTTEKRPIDFLNNLVTKEDLEMLAKKLRQEKESRINRTNHNKGKTLDYPFENKFVKNKRVSKTQPKYKEAKNYRTEGNYLTSKDNKLKKKIYKSQVKRKFKFQDTNHQYED